MAAAANKAVFIFEEQKIFCYYKESDSSIKLVPIRGEHYYEYSADEFENSFKSYLWYLKGTNKIADPETYSCYLIILDNNISFSGFSEAETILRSGFAFAEYHVCKSIDETILKINNTNISLKTFGVVYEYGNSCYFADKSTNTVKLIDKAQTVKQRKDIIKLEPEAIAKSLLEPAKAPLRQESTPLNPEAPPKFPGELTPLQKKILEDGQT